MRPPTSYLQTWQVMQLQRSGKVISNTVLLLLLSPLLLQI
jgi:hypothetical protein